MQRFFIVLSLLLLVAPSLHAQGKVHVKAHVTKKGQYVAPHVRTAPNNKRTDNWSSKPNVNPYTGKKGTVDPYRVKSKAPAYSKTPSVHKGATSKSHRSNR